MQFKTPILLITFNRPDKTKKLIDFFSKIKVGNLFISRDGPRDNNHEEKKLCDQVAKIVKNIEWKCDTNYLISDKNLSCKVNVVKSIDWFFSKVDNGIILEDDCLPSETFFYFCENLLKKYSENRDIMHINGTNLGLDLARENCSSYFLSKLCNVWGWATWKRAWILYERDFVDYNKLIKNDHIKGYYENSEIYMWMKKYFDNAYSKKDKIWSSNWSYTLAKHNSYCISPSKNLVKNIGFDGSGTSGKSNRFSKFSDVDINDFNSIIHPEKLEYKNINDTITFKSIIENIDPRASKNLNLLEMIKKAFKL